MATLFKRNPSTREGLRVRPSVRALIEAASQIPHRFFHFYANGKSAARATRDLWARSVHDFEVQPGALVGQARDDPVVLHYPCCGFEHFWRKYKSLGAFADHWVGVVSIRERIGSFHLEARDVVLSGDVAAARRFYRERMVIEDTALIERLLDAGVFGRVERPAQILGTLQHQALMSGVALPATPPGPVPFGGGARIDDCIALRTPDVDPRALIRACRWRVTLGMAVPLRHHSRREVACVTPPVGFRRPSARRSLTARNHQGSFDCSNCNAVANAEMPNWPGGSGDGAGRATNRARLLRIGGFSLALTIASIVAIGGWIAAHQTVVVVEFVDGGKHGYVVANDAEEAARVEPFVTPTGWTRTGGQFTAFAFPWPGRIPVCVVAAQADAPSLRSVPLNADDCVGAANSAASAPGNGTFYLARPSGPSCGDDAGTVWHMALSASQGARHHRLTADATVRSRAADARGGLAERVMCAPVSEEEQEADVVRLLEQATLGPTEALVREVQATGVARWIDEQLALNVTPYTQYPYDARPQDASFASLCVDDASPPVTPEKYCHTYRISPSPVGWEFFRQSATAPDQLRLRMAHAWHQILVTSDGNGTYAYADFHQRLRDNVFGTFENLLLRFALSPQLGEYQNWIRNVPEHDGIRPNENFARELMQLFTIGVNELNEDGTVKRDAAGQLVPTYEQSDIETLARVLTGFSFPPVPGAAPQWAAPNHYIGEMVPHDKYHDRGPKRLLKGAIDLPAGGGAMDDVRAAIHALTLHANTPPFISRQLIQKLVTSSPTPGYVARVAAVFKDNGRGVRGDLGAVTRAILLDPEARGARKIDPEYGRLREPALFWTSMIRGLDVVTDGVMPYVLSGESGQLLFLAPSVFNYYPSDYTLAGEQVPAPEFGIFTSTEYLRRANHVNQLLHNVDNPTGASWRPWLPEPYVTNAKGTPSPSLAAFLPDAGNAEALVTRVDRLFLHGTMRPAMRSVIVDAVNAIAPENGLRRVKLALHLTLASIDYHVQR